MTQPTEAVGGEDNAPEPTLEDRLTAALETGEEAQEEEEHPQEEGEEPTAEADDEPEIEVEADDLPPIDAPVSWDAEAKAVFASLPREAQEIVTKREAERERFVQQKSQEAARARHDVEQAALAQLAQLEHGYANHFQQLAEQFNPQRPNPELLRYDQATYYSQLADYENAVAQRQQLQQQSQAFAQQAQEREALAQQQEAAREHQLIVEQFPEYLDPTNGMKIRQDLSAVARDLGYPPELIEQARAPDILAMRKAAEWKAKAEKYDGLMARQMEKVRSAKGKPPVSSVPGSRKAPGAVKQDRYAADRDAMRRGDKDAELRVLRHIINT